MTTIRPLGNRIVVKRWPETELTESGLWLPSDAREKPQLGDVIAVGPGVRARFKYLKEVGVPNMLIAPDIIVGDVVVFEKFVSLDYQVRVNDEDFLILPYSTIYAVITDLDRDWFNKAQLSEQSNYIGPDLTDKVLNNLLKS